MDRGRPRAARRAGAARARRLLLHEAAGAAEREAAALLQGQELERVRRRGTLRRLSTFQRQRQVETPKYSKSLDFVKVI